MTQGAMSQARNIELRKRTSIHVDRPTKWRTWEWIALTALLVLSLYARLVFLDRAPPGVRFDELVNVEMADHIYAGEWPIYFQEAWGHEPLYHYFHAVGMALMGKTVLGVRIASILLGVVGVFTAYLAFRLLFGPGIALISAMLLAVSLWSLMYSRIGLRHISLPPWIGLSVYGFWRGLRSPVDRSREKTVWFALGGLCLGVMLYTYFASRVVPFIFLAFTLYLILFHRHMLGGRWFGLVLFFGLPMLIVAPMVLYLRQHPELEQRLGQVGAEILSALQAGNPGPFLASLGRTLLMFSFKGDPEWLYNISGRPVFDPVTAVAFYGGVLVCLRHWRKPSRAFALIWLGVGIVPTVLSWPSGSLGHTIAAQPVTLAFPAIFLATLWQQAPTRRWVHWALRGLVVAVILNFAAINGYDYFVRWPQYPDVRHEYQAPVTAVARYLEKYDKATAGSLLPGDNLPSVAVSAPYIDYWNPWSKRNFDLFYHRRQAVGSDDAAVRWFNGASSLLLPRRTGDTQKTFYFLPDHIRMPSALDPDLYALLTSGSRVVETGYSDPNGATFDLYLWHDRRPLEQRLQTVVSAPVWTSPEGPYVPGRSEKERRERDLPLDIGHRLSLLGYTGGRQQLSGSKPARITTYWQVLDANSDPLAIFVHILDDANSVVAGWDGLHISTETWQPGDVFIQIHELYPPDDISPGIYRIELGVYSPITHERLSIYTDAEDETAPHDRVLLLPASAR